MSKHEKDNPNDISSLKNERVFFKREPKEVFVPTEYSLKFSLNELFLPRQPKQDNTE